jgi:tRNA (mo5U34)-methyltransferase
MDDLAVADVAKEAASHWWWHSIDLGNGIVTKGRKTPRIMAIEFENTFSKLDLRHKTVLDIGAWNGGFSLEAYRRGALSVTGLDHYTWNHPTFRGRESFEFVSRVTRANLGAIDIDLDAPILDLRGIGHFDVVLFLGVFYHLKNPVGVLQQISNVVGEVLVLETYVERSSEDRPTMVFFPGRELNNDPTNWWGPNKLLVSELLKMVGFRRVVNSRGDGNNREIFHAYRT